MVSYKKMEDAKECEATVLEEDLNYKNAFSFCTMENYQNFLNSYSQNHFLNDGTKSVQDDAIYDILYGQLPDIRRPVENMAPKKINTPYSAEQTLPNCHHMPARSELRQPHTEEINQNGPCLDFPMDLSNAYLQIPGFYESQGAYSCVNSAYPVEALDASSVPTGFHYSAAYGEPKNVQSNVYCHSMKDHLPDSAAVFSSDRVYTRSFEILRDNSEHKFQAVQHLEQSVKGSDSLNGFKSANKDVTINNYHNFQPSNSRTLSAATEKYSHSDWKNPMTSRNVSLFTETAISNSEQCGGYEGTENFDRVLASLKNSPVPDFPFYLDFDDVSNARPNLTTDMSAGSKNGNLSSKNLHYKFMKENLHPHNKSNSEMFLTPENSFNGSKHFEHVFKHKSFGNSDESASTVNKRQRTDFTRIPSVGDPSKQIPTVNIAIHQISNSYKIPQSNYMNLPVLNTRESLSVVDKNVYSTNRKRTKASTSKKAVHKVPVSIRARNAKFLCEEKDLRCRTVRELLETCETIKNKMNLKAEGDPCMNIPADVLARDSSELTLIAPRMDCLNNLSKDRKYDENKPVETARLQTLPEFQDQKIGINLPNLSTPRIYDLRNLPRTIVSPDSVRVYQPETDAWKKVKFANDKKNAFKPKHFDFTFLQIRNFKALKSGEPKAIIEVEEKVGEFKTLDRLLDGNYFCNDSDEKRTSKLKLIFSKKKLVYEFQLKETFDSSGGCIKHLAMIEIKFANIVSMWGHQREIRLEVNEPPHMYVGTRYCNKEQQFGPHQNAQYDRSRTTDLTVGELYQVPFHYIRLRMASVNKVLSYMSRFSPHFERMLRCPLIEDANKVLPPLRLIAPNMLPIGINKIYTCQTTSLNQTNK